MKRNDPNSSIMAWERKNRRQMRQAREISQTRLSLQIFRPNLNEKIKPHFLGLFGLIPHYLPLRLIG